MLKKSPSTGVVVGNMHGGRAITFAPSLRRPIVPSKWLSPLIPLVEVNVVGSIGVPDGCWVGSKFDVEILKSHK